VKDKVVLITGGGTGFGQAMALAFATAGCKVLISGRRAETLRETVAQFEAGPAGGAMAWIQADMSSSEGASRMVDRALELWGGVDVMINNAGGGIRLAPFDEYSQEEIGLILQANLMTAICGCHAVIPVMKSQRSGVIINVLSVCARYAWPTWGAYTAAKMGVLGLTRCLYAELRPHGIRVGSLIPGAAATQFAAAMNMPDRQDDDRLHAEDVAAAAFLMASMPERAFVEELVIWGTDQEVIPR